MMVWTRAHFEREVSSRISRLVRNRDDWSQERDAGSDDSKTAYARRDHSASIEDDPSPAAVVKICSGQLRQSSRNVFSHG